MTATLTPNPVSTSLFRWKPNGDGFAEASDLPDRGRFTRVYPDAADVGLTLVSHVTNKQVVCVVTNERYDREGDLMYWELKPVGGERDFTVTIFND